MEGKIDFPEDFMERIYFKTYLNIALYNAIDAGKDDLVVELLRKGKASPNFMLNSLNSCLSKSVSKCSLETIKFLIETGADINSTKGNLLMAAIQNFSRIDVFDYLCPPADNIIVNVVDVDVNVVDPITKMTPLATVCWTLPNDNSFTILNRIIAKVGPGIPLLNINLKNAAGQTPLASAVVNGHSMEFVQKLLDIGADPKILPIEYKTWEELINKSKSNWFEDDMDDETEDQQSFATLLLSILTPSSAPKKFGFFPIPPQKHRLSASPTGQPPLKVSKKGN
jgi:ankyrin repeat protein